MLIVKEINFRSRIYQAIGCLLCLCVLNACVDEVDLNVNTNQRSIVFDGFVTDSLGDFTLNISESSIIGVGNDNILDPIVGATAKLVDSDGIEYPYQQTEESNYELKSFKVLRDRSYYLDVVLPDGRHYQSTPGKLRSSSLIDSISYDIFEDSFRNSLGEFESQIKIQAKIATDISQAEEPPFLRWRVTGEYQFLEGFPGALNPRYCYVPINLDLNEIRLLNGSEINDGRLFEQVIAEAEYDFRFAIQFCFHISQYSISEEEYSYWSNIKEVIDIDGGLFDPPPGTIIGNIRNVDNPDEIPVGYFSVSSVFFKRAFVNRDDTDYFIRGKCEGFQRFTQFGCRDCTELNRSSLDRPPYWEF